jgi:hypothetical protein
MTRLRADTLSDGPHRQPDHGSEDDPDPYADPVLHDSPGLNFSGRPTEEHPRSGRISPANLVVSAVLGHPVRFGSCAKHFVHTVTHHRYLVAPVLDLPFQHPCLVAEDLDSAFVPADEFSCDLRRLGLARLPGHLFTTTADGGFLLFSGELGLHQVQLSTEFEDSTPGGLQFPRERGQAGSALRRHLVPVEFGAEVDDSLTKGVTQRV